MTILRIFAETRTPNGGRVFHGQIGEMKFADEEFYIDKKIILNTGEIVLNHDDTMELTFEYELEKWKDEMPSE